MDYPELRTVLADPLPSPTILEDELGPLDVRVVPVPARCRDGFLVSFWDRPELVLDPEARAATSAFANLETEIQERVAERLAADLRAGEWDRRHGELRTLSEFDAGLRLVIARG